MSLLDDISEILFSIDFGNCFRALGVSLDFLFI